MSGIWSMRKTSCYCFHFLPRGTGKFSAEVEGGSNVCVRVRTALSKGREKLCDTFYGKKESELIREM